MFGRNQLEWALSHQCEHDLATVLCWGCCTETEGKRDRKTWTLTAVGLWRKTKATYSTYSFTKIEQRISMFNSRLPSFMKVSRNPCVFQKTSNCDCFYLTAWDLTVHCEHIEIARFAHSIGMWNYLQNSFLTDGAGAIYQYYIYIYTLL